VFGGAVLIELSYDSLRKAQLEERHDPAQIRPLPEDYYESYADYLERLKRQLSASFTMEDAKAFENSSAVFNDLFELRKRKIVFKALKDVTTGTANGEGLTRQEKRLYAELSSLFRSYDGERCVVPRKQAAGAQSAPQCAAAPQNAPEIRILMDLPQFVGGDDNANYGPYKTGERVALPESVAALLLKRNAAQKL